MNQDYVQGINGDGKALAFNVVKNQLYPSQNLEINCKDGSSLYCLLDENGRLPGQSNALRGVEPEGTPERA